MLSTSTEALEYIATPGHQSQKETYKGKEIVLFTQRRILETKFRDSIIGLEKSNHKILRRSHLIIKISPRN